MILLRGNSRLIYDVLQRLGGGAVSFGTLACLVGCHKNTVKNVVHDMAARGLICYESDPGRPNRYKV